MRLVSFRFEGRSRFGALTPAGIVDLASADCPDLRCALAQQRDLDRAVERAGGTIPAEAVTLLPPIVAPDKILCVGYNYRTHLAETNVPIPKYPSFFVRFPSSLVGHGTPVILPFLSEQFDFEGELAVVIGRGGRHIPAERALAHVAGYACLAENSVRDYQRHAGQATAGKNFEHSGAFGPWMVTADEIPDPSALTLVTRLNGAEMQRSGTDDLIFSVPELIAYASSFTRLLPGDVISTGTPGGVGMTRTPPLWLKDGDRVDIEISSIGVLSNPVSKEQRDS